MLKWIVLAVFVVALVVLGLAVRPVLVRLPRLHRSVRRLQRREQELLRLQHSAAVLEETLAGLQERGTVAQDRLAVIRAGRGRHDG